MEICKTRSATNWWLGDWWNYGTRQYGEMKALVDSPDWDGPGYETLKRCSQVAAEFEQGRRRPSLRFTHHQEVVALPRESQEALLDRAEAEGLSKNALRAEVIKEKVRLAEELERRQAEWQAMSQML